MHPSDFENRTARELCAIYLAWREGCRALDGEPNPDGTLTKYKLVEYPAGGEWERWAASVIGLASSAAIN